MKIPGDLSRFSLVDCGLDKIDSGQELVRVEIIVLFVVDRTYSGKIRQF